MMRHLWWAMIAVLVAGCASAKKAPPDDWQSKSVEPGPAPGDTVEMDKSPHSHKEYRKQSYIGRRGFLARPPLFIDAVSQSFFQRCSPIVITGVHVENKRLVVTAKQENYTLTISGINRKIFRKRKDGRMPLLSRYLVKNLDVLQSARRPSAAQNPICSGGARPNLDAKQFRFIAGDPEYRKVYKGPQGQFDVWAYQGLGHTNPQFYYFRDGRLYSWTR